MKEKFEFETPILEEAHFGQFADEGGSYKDEDAE